MTPKFTDIKLQVIQCLVEGRVLHEARDDIENNYNIDLSKYRVATNHHSRFNWNSFDLELCPVSLIDISRSFDLAYLMEKIGRLGILDLFQKPYPIY